MNSKDHFLLPLTVVALMPFVSAQAQTDSRDETADDVPIEVITIVGEDEVSRLTPQGAQTGGVFGGDKPVIEVPRSLTPLSSALIEDAAMMDLNDLNRLVPNTFSASGFNSASLPTIRGQLGEVFTNGLRRQGGNNGFGIPLSFNSVEQMDVAKGMPPVILGTTQRTGGFLNVQSKRPDIEQKQGRVSVSAGRWEEYRGQIDVSTPIEKGRSGLRVSYERRDEGSFYDFSQYDSDNLFVAGRWLLNNGGEFNTSFEYFDVDFTDNAGINRPTQDLIDHGIYITGQGEQPNGSQVPGPGAVISPTGEVVIPRNRVLTDPDNISTAETFIWHGTYEQALSANLRLVNRSYYESMSRDNIAKNSFVEIIDSAKTAENRVELHYDLSADQRLIGGVNVRYNSVLGYSQFTTEADNPSDLTGPIANRRIPLTDAQKERFVELRPGLFVSPGGQYDLNNDGAGDYNLSDTTDSVSWQTGLFAQHEIDFTDEWRLTTGLRGDWYDVDARDPLAPEGVTAAQDSIHEFLKAGEVNLLYRPAADWSLYATAAYAESTSNSMGGGNVLGADNRISQQNFATENTLYEVGVKWAPAGTRWYADATLFEQTRSLRNRDGSNTGIKTQGAETQVYFTAERWRANAGLTYLDARYDNSAASQGTRQVADAFDDSRPDIIEGTGVGSPNFTAFPPSTRRVQGLPRVSANLSGRYQLTSQWAVGADGVYTESYPLDYLGTVMIRDQFQLNTHLRYALNAQTEVRLDVLNATDEENWSPVFEGGYFGATLAMPSLPRHWRVSVRHNF
jgi:outer membrane receptor protein involved in Fe transport